MDNDLLSTLSIGAMLIGILFVLGYPRGHSRHERGFAVFALGAALTLASWLTADPANLAQARQEIAIALVGLIVIFIKRLGQRA